MTEESKKNMVPIQRKGRAKQFQAVKPFPTFERMPIAFFNGNDFEVFDKESVAIFYGAGQFGLNPMPRQASTQTKNTLSEPNSTEIPSLPKSLIFFPEEVFFLHHHLKCLKVLDISDEIISTDDLWMKISSLKENFAQSFVSYLYLKSKNWVIKPGLKFGGDFLLYKHGPHLHHATYIAKVSKAGKSVHEYHNSQRIAETTGKNLLYLEVLTPEGLSPEDYLSHLESFEVQELLVQRHEMIKQK